MVFGSRVNHALIVASRVHQGQFRKGTDIPFVPHPVAVAMIVEEYADEEDVVIAALLHDVLEDVSAEIYSEDDMGADFGDRVVGIVKDVSEDKKVGELEKPWRERKEGYLTHLRGLSDEAPLMVSVADKIHNLMSILADYEQIGEAVWDRFNASREDELWYYGEISALVAEKSLPEGLKTRYNELFGKLEGKRHG